MTEKLLTGTLSLNTNKQNLSWIFGIDRGLACEWLVGVTNGPTLCFLSVNVCANLKIHSQTSGSLVFKTNGALGARFSCAMIHLVELTIDKCHDQYPRGSGCDPMNLWMDYFENIFQFEKRRGHYTRNLLRSVSMKSFIFFSAVKCSFYTRLRNKVIGKRAMIPDQALQSATSSLGSCWHTESHIEFSIEWDNRNLKSMFWAVFVMSNGLTMSPSRVPYLRPVRVTTADSRSITHPIPTAAPLPKSENIRGTAGYLGARDNVFQSESRNEETFLRGFVTKQDPNHICSATKTS